MVANRLGPWVPYEECTAAALAFELRILDLEQGLRKIAYNDRIGLADAVTIATDVLKHIRQ